MKIYMIMMIDIKHCSSYFISFLFLQTWRVPAPGDYHIPQVALNETHATVVMLTHNRTSVMLQTAEHFLSMGFISKVVILWNNIGLEPPTAELEQIEKNQGKSLVLKEFTENKIRLRFHLYKEIDTAGENVVVFRNRVLHSLTS